MSENLKLLIVDPDVNYRTDLRKQVARAGVDVVGEADYGASALSMAEATKPDSVLVAWQEPAARVEQTLESLSLYLPSAPIVAYSDIEDLAAARRAIHAGAHDYLTKPLGPKDILDSFHKVLLQMERRRMAESGTAQAVTEGIVIAVFGAKGGIGKTTLSTNLATALSQYRRESVALLDIDTRFGDVALVLDLNPEKSVSDAVRAIDEIDRYNIKSYLTPHPSGVDVLAAPTRPSEWRQVKPGHIEKLIKLLSQTHDYVILDTPGFFTELVGVALDMADLVLLVTTLDVSSIKDSSMALDMLATADFPMERVKLVVNHPTNVNSVRPQQVQDVTGTQVFWDIPFDKQFIRAGQLGSPVTLTKPGSKGARNIIQLARSISGGERGGKLFRRGKQPVRMDQTLSGALEEEDRRE